jgi:hypothetical protein
VYVPYGMQDWSIPLAVATAAFLVALVWRVRPLVGGRPRGIGRDAIRAAHARIDAAQTDAERAEALCDAAGLVGTGSAKGLYLRAMRAAPASVAIVERAAVSLARRPRALEALLWRRLAAAPWTASPQATAAALDVLARLYEGPLRNAVRANAMTNAREALLPRKGAEGAASTSPG